MNLWCVYIGVKFFFFFLNDDVEEGVQELSSLRSPTVVSEVDQFCGGLGGKRPIHSILIANNGMAAVKFIRSKAITLVAMATPEDLRINAEHIRIAYQFVEVPAWTNNNSYTNVQLIVEFGLVRATPLRILPDALNEKGIVFLGPPSTSMAEGIASCQVVGYPTMIKASWRGGGNGIRRRVFDKSKSWGIELKIGYFWVFLVKLSILCVTKFCHKYQKIKKINKKKILSTKENLRML
ncbi:hypothetical protein UlMin_025158 [Ulmus minor]